MIEAETCISCGDVLVFGANISEGDPSCMCDFCYKSFLVEYFHVEEIEENNAENASDF